MTNYIIQTIVFQFLFLAVYELLLKKETFFQWNRLYLCITPLIALVLPFIKIPALKTTIPQNIEITLPEITLGATPDTAQNTLATATSGISAFGMIVLVGIVVSVAFFLWKLYKISSLKRKGKPETFKNTTLIHLPNSTDAFSFVNLIFLGENLDITAKKHIISHELVHVRQKHYVDLLYFEVLRILFWFNPLIYFFQNRVAILHEYIADTQAIATTDKKTYYQNLLTEVFQTQHISFINTFFNHSLIKKRIVMLQKSKSKKTQLIKYLMLLPVMTAMLCVTSCEEKESQTTAEAEKSGKPVMMVDTIRFSKNAINDVPFAVIDQVPVYPGCENLSTNEERKQCFADKITQLVSENFDTAIGKKIGLEGRQRITVQFKIDKDGNASDIIARSPDKALVEEAERVMNLIPQMKPGEHNGKEVGVSYSLPIIFEVRSQDE